MDEQRFISQLESFYRTPDVEKFQQVGDRAYARIGQLLNGAVGCLEADEIFCEVGQGSPKLLGEALRDRPDCFTYSVHDFSTIPDSESELTRFLEFLANLNLEEQVYVCDQSFIDFALELREVESEGRIGVLCLSGVNDYRSLLMGLLLIRQFLAERALIVLLDVDSEVGQQACWDFMATCPEGQVLLENLGLNHNLLMISWNQQCEESLKLFDLQDKQNEQVIRDLKNFTQIYQQLEQIYQQALMLHQQGQFEAAEERYKELLIWRPNDAIIWSNLGFLYYQIGDYREALLTFWKGLQIDELNGVSYYYLGLIYEHFKQFDQAIAAFQKSIELTPDLSLAFVGLAQRYLREGKTQEALSVYEDGIEKNSDDAKLYHHFGHFWLELDQINSAIQAYETALSLELNSAEIRESLELAIALNNQSPDAYLTLARRYYQQQRYSSAIAPYQHYLSLAEGSPEIYYELSESFAYAHQGESAIALLKTAAQKFPKDAQIQFSLILKLLRNGEIPQAIIIAENASTHLPEDYTFKQLKYLIIPPFYNTPEEIDLYRQRFLTGLDRLIAETRLETPQQQQSALEATQRFTNFYLGYQAYNIIEPQKRYGQLLHRILAANFPQWTVPLEMPVVGDKIRIGYVSHYLHAYSGTLWLTGWLKYCDRAEFSIHCYYTGNAPDSITQEFRSYSDKFYHFPHNLSATCQQIRNDNLHILVFPEVGMDPQTMQIAALRLAPIQCVAWGHPVTTGLPTIDYFLSSQLMEPKNAQDHYSETLIKLPNIGVSYPKPQDIPALTKTRSHFDLPEDAVLYFCCQAPYKYLPQYDRIFPQIALKVPQAKFLFLRGTQLKPRLAKAFAEFGLNSEDYCLHRQIPDRSDYLMLNLLCDIFLDTLTWSGGNTSLEAIACNLPIVTCPGEFMRGRHADSFLKMIDITDTIAQNEAEYIEIAVRLGLDPQWRQDLREHLKQNHDLLFEDRACVTALESFFQQAVQQKTASN